MMTCSRDRLGVLGAVGRDARPEHLLGFRDGFGRPLGRARADRDVVARAQQTQRQPEPFSPCAAHDRDIHDLEAYGTRPGTPVLGSAGVETVTWAIELGVGIACLVVGSTLMRGGRRRVVGAVFLLAGLAAASHATVQLL